MNPHYVFTCINSTYIYRLALKAFTDQKRRFFPHLDDGHDSQSTESASKKHCSSQALPASLQEDLSDCKTLSDVLTRLEKEMPNFKVFTYERLDWLKRASSLPNSTNESPVETSKGHTFHTLNKLRTGSQGPVTTDKAAVIELLFPSVFRAIVSLHPAGSIDPDAVAFFSPDEVTFFIRSPFFSILVLYIGMTGELCCSCLTMLSSELHHFTS